ncbi:hypothetical protein HPP92_006827 [Vanilla planifolia]|uniref:Uncharacterized protein n=1 Tax=Vanilla planifolia TaxID=51239 RepID=A0A835RF43_VANPL|nr:hypothetical protein HPP92_006827 [Vanilla planifolia]
MGVVVIDKPGVLSCDDGAAELMPTLGARRTSRFTGSSQGAVVSMRASAAANWCSIHRCQEGR